METPTAEVLFTHLGLSEQILKAVVAMGYTAPTDIQAKTIPILLEKKDLIGQAQTGTGKTVAFGIPIVSSIDASSRTTQAIILCPTRELALQVAKQIEALCQFTPGIRVATLVGGQPLEPQIRSLKQGAQIVVGTPGRVIDHIDRNILQLQAVKFAVLDEADEMLDMGFRDDIETILKKTPAERQTALFSATMPVEIKRLAKEYQKNPEIVNLVPKEISNASIEQICFEIPNQRKSDLLASLLDIDQPALSIAFCNTIQRVDELTRKLQEAGYSADSLHGDMRQSRRDRVMDRFRSGECKILIATDVAARGIDVAGIDVVFNVDLPMDHENYVHRIGRTGRAGLTGKAYSFVSGRDRMLLKTITRYTNGVIEQRQAPSNETVEQARAQRIFEKIATEGVSDGKLEKYIAIIKAQLQDTGDAVKLAASLLRTIIYKNRPIQSESSQDESRPRRSFGDREGGRSFDRGGGDRRSGGFSRDRDGDSRGGRPGGRRPFGFDRGEGAPRSFDRGGDREGGAGRSFERPEGGRSFSRGGDREGGRSFDRGGDRGGRSFDRGGDREGGFGGGRKEWSPKINISEGSSETRSWRPEGDRRSSEFGGRKRHADNHAQ